MHKTLDLALTTSEKLVAFRVALDAVFDQVEQFTTVVVVWDVFYSLTTISKDVQLFLGRMAEPMRQLFVELIEEEFLQDLSLKQIFLVLPGHRALEVSKLRSFVRDGQPVVHHYTLASVKEGRQEGHPHRHGH